MDSPRESPEAAYNHKKWLHNHRKWSIVTPMEAPIETLLGRTAAKLLLYLFHYDEAYATGAAKDLGIQQSAVQRQLEKLEASGFLVSRQVGRTRLYRLNPKSPAARKLREFVGVFYEGMPLAERERMFHVRRRPRRRGKPVRGA